MKVSKKQHKALQRQLDEAQAKALLRNCNDITAARHGLMHDCGSPTDITPYNELLKALDVAEQEIHRLIYDYGCVVCGRPLDGTDPDSAHCTTC